MSIEAMKQALEALEPDVYKAEWVVEQDIQKAITSLRQAIAEAEKQKPVAWRHKGQPWEFKTDYCINLPDVVPDSWEPLYTHPQPKRQPLTDAEIEELWHEDTFCDMPDELKQFKHTARAIEAAHGIGEKK